MALGVLGTEPGQEQATQQQLQKRSGFEGEIAEYKTESAEAEKAAKAAAEAEKAEINAFGAKFFTAIEALKNKNIKLSILANNGNLTDNVGNPIPAAFILKTNAPHEIAALAKQFGLNIIPVGAATSGNGSFGPKGQLTAEQTNAAQNTVAIQLISENTAIPTKHRNLANSFQLETSQDGRITIHAGAGLTTQAINEHLKTLEAPAGYLYQIPTNPTTVNMAQLGAVIATGAKGPNRTSIAPFLESLTISINGELVTLANQQEIQTHIGLLGLGGTIVAAELEPVLVPKSEQIWLLPLKGTTDQDLAAVTSEFLTATRTLHTKTVTAGKVQSLAHNPENPYYIDGIEIICLADLQLVQAIEPSEEVQKMINVMQAANAKYMLYMPVRYVDEEAYQSAMYEQLSTILKESAIEHLAISANTPATKEAREAIPSAARANTLPDKTVKNTNNANFIVASQSTDFDTAPDHTLATTPEAIQASIAAQIQAYLDFNTRNQTELIAFVKEKTQIDIGILLAENLTQLYGHLQPSGITNSERPNADSAIDGLNLHARHTVKVTKANLNSDQQQQVENAIKEFIKASKTQLLTALQAAPNIKVGPGEKAKVFPEDFGLLTKFEQIAAIAAIVKAGPQINHRVAHINPALAQKVTKSPTNQPSPAVVN
jgi:hypothetical protein